jgi:ferredoxin
MSTVPGMGLVRGMGLTLRRFFAPKATIMWPEQHADVAPKFRGRLQLLYDEYGTLKCETCFQCAQACPVECIDMGGVDTRGRFHVHWGASETYAERREESAMRRAGRPVADAGFQRFAPQDVSVVGEIAEAHDYEPKDLLPMLEDIQAEYGYLPVAALKALSRQTGAWYAIVYGVATSFKHLRMEPPTVTTVAPAGEGLRKAEAGYLSALDAALAGKASA